MNSQTCLKPYAICAQLSWQRYGAIVCHGAPVAALSLFGDGAHLPSKKHDLLGHIGGLFA